MNALCRHCSGSAQVEFAHRETVECGECRGTGLDLPEFVGGLLEESETALRYRSAGDRVECVDAIVSVIGNPNYTGGCDDLDDAAALIAARCRELGIAEHAARLEMTGRAA
jgi:hypothetical protein